MIIKATIFDDLTIIQKLKEIVLEYFSITSALEIKEMFRNSNNYKDEWQGVIEFIELTENDISSRLDLLSAIESLMYND